MKKIIFKGVLVTAIGGAWLMGAPAQGLAAGFQLKEQSAEGQGNSFAGSTAKAYDASTIFFNPAGMTRLKGSRTEVHATLIAPHAEQQSGSSCSTCVYTGKDEDGGVSAWVPALYGVYDYSDDLKFGISVNVPFGLSTNYEAGWVGAEYNLESKIETQTVTPSVAYRINKALSIGGGIAIQHLKGKLTRDASPLTKAVEEVKLEADDLGFGVTAGALYEYSDRGRLGLSYRSQVRHKLDGDVVTPTSYFGATADLTTPDVVSAGLYHELNDTWAVMADVAWTNWSVFKSLDVYSKVSGSLATSTQYHWDDTWFSALGLSYKYNNKLKFQTGLAYDTGAANDTYRTAGIPDSDRLWGSFGVSYKENENLEASIGYTHIWGKDAKVTESGKNSSYNTVFDTSVNILALNVTWKF